MKTIAPKKPKKDERERSVLLGLVELYLEMGKPIGSNTLRENGFEDLSSATIRNYFASLEESGYLKQQHSSGGRIPTPLAYQLYANTYLNAGKIDEKEKRALQERLSKESREIAEYLQVSAEVISNATNCAVFLSAPRFDQDFVIDMKLLKIDQVRFLCVVVTDFGLVYTDVLRSEKNLTQFTLKRFENYFRWRLTGIDKPILTPEEEGMAKHFYNEIMLRHIVRYTNFTKEDIYKTGFSKLLMYSDFNDATALASGLSLFESQEHMRSILKACADAKQISTWVGSDLYAFSEAASCCSVICVPYQIHQSVVGAIGILGPNRIPYRKIYGILQSCAETISDCLTRSMYKFKISYRNPKSPGIDMKGDRAHFLDPTQCLLLENKTSEENT